MRRTALSLIMLASCSPKPDSSVDIANQTLQVTPAPVTTANKELEKDDPRVIAAISMLQGQAKIKDVLYQPNAAVQWSVGVFDDGTPRDGYAQSVCIMLKERDIPTDDVIVRVVDIAKITQGGVPGRSTSLGSAICKDGSRFD